MPPFCHIGELRLARHLEMTMHGRHNLSAALGDPILERKSHEISEKSLSFPQQSDMIWYDSLNRQQSDLKVRPTTNTWIYFRLSHHQGTRRFLETKQQGLGQVVFQYV